ncbi:hypothetical protein DDO73_18190 [Vibrio cholerae]|nr:hypothetical protein [Vibrio cholerae]HBN6882727.1 hypothetical protein [Vibrio cholerae]HBN6886722.1 hypothetical protein [Vibrio cholerae]HBN6897506.1 hypothetical protein [Vibrio cholerae]
MSTKIYNGLILRNSTLENALQLLSSRRQECIQKAINACAKVSAKLIAQQMDLSTNFSCVSKDKFSSFQAPFLSIERAMIDVLVKQHRNPKWDYSFEVCLLPWHEHVLALFYIENDIEYRKTLLSAGFEDYHYQDSTDKPSEISEQEWEMRRLAWEEALPIGTNPIDRGLSFSLVTWHDYLYDATSEERISANMPSESERRKSVARQLLSMELAITDSDLTAFELAEKVHELLPSRMQSVLILSEK